MSIYIYGVDLPQHGFINLTVFANGHVVGPDDGFNSFDTVAGRAIPVPEHGRTIDADALLMRINHEAMEAYMDGVCYGVHPSQEYLDLLGEIIDDAPTIVPANKEGRI